NPFWCKLSLLLVSSLTIMAGATVAASLPAIQRAFVDTENVELLTRLIVTMPALAIAILSPLSGWAVDRFGRTKLLYSGMLLYGIAGVSGGLVNDLYQLLALRLILGVSVSMTMTSVLTLVGDYFKGEERTRFLALQSAFMGFGGVLFITSGGWLASMSWRAPFFIYAAALVFLPLAVLMLKEPDRVRREARANVGTKTAGASDGLNKRLALFVYGVLSIVFVLFYAIPTQGPFYIEGKFHVSTTAVGMVVASMTLSSAVVSLLYPYVKRKTSYLGVFGYTFFFIGISFLLFSWAPTYGFAMMALFIGGMGMGLLMPNASVWLMDISPEEMRGRVMGGMTTAVFLGQFASPFITQPLAISWGFERTFTVLGSTLVAGAAAVLLSTAFFRRWS
ncbi:MAG TPA: MFS transporter, partial [Bacteroidetes bacterium]|nr:MFS transporter [Bacteroidota bacterium]HEX05616.1 MFS transporter [Bacteroidota bacterium]